MKKRLMGLFVTGVLVLGLVGCGSEDKISAEDVDSKREMESLSNANEITMQFENDTRGYLEEMVNFLEYTYPKIQNKDVTDENRQVLIQVTNDFIVYSNDFNLEPISKADRALYEEFQDLIYDVEMVADYALQYIYKQDDVYISLQKDYFNNVKIHISTLESIEKKYKSGF